MWVNRSLGAEDSLYSFDSRLRKAWIASTRVTRTTGPKAGRASFVDVRDVADLHLKAMLASQAGGERFIAVDEFLWLAEVAAILRRELGPDAKRVPTRKVPDLLVKLMGRFDPSVGSIVNQLGKKLTYSSEKARAELEWSPRPVADSIADTGRSLVELGLA